MRNLECFRNASGCLRKTNTTTKGDLYPDAVIIVAASRLGPDESPGRGPLRHRGIFLPQRPRRLQPPPEMRTLGRGLCGRTHPARARADTASGMKPTAIQIPKLGNAPAPGVAVLGRSRDLSTGGFRRFLTASPFGDWLRPRTGA